MGIVVNYMLLPDFAPWECAFLAPALETVGEGRIENRFLTPGGGIVKALGGMRAVADGGLEEVANGDALVLVGGLGWKTDAAEPVKEPVLEFLRTGRPVGAICNGVAFLATLGALNDHAHSGNGVDDLQEWAKDAYSPDRFVELQAVRDGSLVTANGTAPLEFAREFMMALGLDRERIEDWYAFNKAGFYPVGAVGRIPT